MPLHTFYGVRELGLRIRGWGHKNTLESFRNFSWVPILRHWGYVHHSYWAQTDGDIGWWNGERTSVSLFSNAVWLNRNSVALQEYGDEKTRKRRRYQGRPDIYVTIEEYEFLGEAKHCWPQLTGKNEKWLTTVEHGLAAAVADAECLDKQFSRVALCFVAPMVSISHQGDIDRIYQEYCDTDFEFSHIVANGFRVDLAPMAQWRTRTMKFDEEMCGSPVGNIREYYPGCSLLVGFVD